MPPEHYESAVARAVERIRAGELEKIVLAREVQVHAPRRARPGGGARRAARGVPVVLRVLRRAAATRPSWPPAPSCSCAARASARARSRSPARRAAAPTPRSTTTSASSCCATRATARSRRSSRGGSSARCARTRSGSPPRPSRCSCGSRTSSTWRRRSARSWRRRSDALELAGLLHPTPAVGGEPLSRRAPLIPALEGLDRGWYAGPVGWTDATEDGEFCVALRCALLRGAVARCYAGVGVVRDSDPAAELAETEVKLQALLPLLTA